MNKTITQKRRTLISVDANSVMFEKVCRPCRLYSRDRDETQRTKETPEISNAAGAEGAARSVCNRFWVFRLVRHSRAVHSRRQKYGVDYVNDTVGGLEVRLNYVRLLNQDSLYPVGYRKVFSVHVLDGGLG